MRMKTLFLLGTLVSMPVFAEEVNPTTSASIQVLTERLAEAEARGEAAERAARQRLEQVDEHALLVHERRDAQQRVLLAQRGEDELAARRRRRERAPLELRGQLLRQHAHQPPERPAHLACRPGDPIGLAHPALESGRPTAGA